MADANNSLRIEIIARDFNRMLEELHAIEPAIEFGDVVRSEAISVATSAMMNTKAADKHAVRRRAEGREWTTGPGGKKYYLKNRYPDPLWLELDSTMQYDLETRLAAIGLAKKSWAHIARRLGGNGDREPGYVTAANSKGRDFPGNARTSEQGSGTAFSVTIENLSPIVQAAGGRSALVRAMQGRTRFFQMNMEKRAFRTIESRARKYPGIFTSAGSIGA